MKITTEELIKELEMSELTAYQYEDNKVLKEVIKRLEEYKILKRTVEIINMTIAEYFIERRG